jgi:uncharacterized damage-inducible protein DinB
MLNAIDVLVHGLTASKRLLLLYVEDLNPQEYLHRPSENVNCVAWLLGHLALSDRRVTHTMLGVPERDLPVLPDGFEKRFSRDEGCPQAQEFGDVSGLAAIFAAHRDLLIQTVQASDVDRIAQPLAKPHPRFKTAWEAANFMSVHAAMHAGQITVIRRSLGRKPLI